MKSLQTPCERNPSPAGKPPLEGRLRGHNGLRPSVRAAFLAALVALAALASFSAPSWGEPVGRLFFTPGERANLDRARQAGGNVMQEQEQVQESDPSQQPESLTLNGIVQRSSGKTTVWINHAVQNETGFPPGSKMQISKSRRTDFPVLVQKTGKTVTLKVGQTLNVDSGEIRENYQSSAIKVPPPASPAAAEANAAQTSGTGKVNSG
jgi:hypothetical protein